MKNTLGFGLIELIVVIAIVGMLAAIAIPSFLGQKSSAKQSEAKVKLGTAIRQQQGYFIENSEFADTFPKLGLPEQTNLYSYSVFVPASDKNSNAVGMVANPKTSEYKAYLSGIELADTDGYNLRFAAVTCELKRPGIIVKIKDNLLKIRKRKLKCTEDFREVGK